MKQLTLKPENYEYLWTDHDVDFIFTSCYLFDKFRKTDFVLIYDHKAKGLKFFLSKREIKKFSEFGAVFYDKHFSEWKSGIEKEILNGNELIKQTSNDLRPVLKLSNAELKDRFMGRVNLFQSLAGKYFYTEYFFMGIVEDLIKKYPKKYAAIARNLDETARIKFKAREVLTMFYDYNKLFMPYIEEIAKRINRKDLRWLSFHEIADIIDGKNIEISDRDKFDWVLAKKNKWNLVKGDEASHILKLFEDHFFHKNLKEIKGIVANSGIYKGKAKIVRTLFSDRIVEELKKVNKGDVLVAETTGPEMMVACEKAGAIVTDEGGMTSHAAIISRELGIPCIVGAKIATKLLKDGDFVEVDAEKGVVRKLS